jgi:hypothetical protein
VESHTADEAYKFVDMTRLLDDLSEVYASQAEQAEIDFDVGMPEESVNILADEGQIRQAVGNLLENALKFTPGKGQVYLSARLEDRMLKISVTDTRRRYPALIQSLSSRQKHGCLPGKRSGFGDCKSHCRESPRYRIWSQHRKRRSIYFEPASAGIIFLRKI